jgi:hypothetical protein
VISVVSRSVDPLTIGNWVPFGVGVPNNKFFEQLDVTIPAALPLYELCAGIILSAL